MIVDVLRSIAVALLALSGCHFYAAEECPGENPGSCSSGACADTDVHWFATFDEYATFDPVTLCAP